MKKETKENIRAIFFIIIAVGAALYVGWIVIQEQVIQVNEYCDSLVLNHTISNRSECNITVEGMAQITGCNMSSTGCGGGY